MTFNRSTSGQRFAVMRQVTAITGHKHESITGILLRYVALNRDMADAAIDGLVDWMEKEGIDL